MVFLRLPPGAVPLLVVAWLLSSPVEAGIVNRTIDDTFGDSQTNQLVTYSPTTAGVWQDETCVGCAIVPDVSQAFKGTYTAATYNPGLGSMGISMQFSGTAIYVFFILANNQGDGITTLTLANFSVDGGAPQLFQHVPDLTTTAIQYNQLVFSQTNLPNASHTLDITTSGVNENVYVNFDYAIYTHVDPASPVAPVGTTTTTSGTTTSSTATSTGTTATGATTSIGTSTSPTISAGKNGTTTATVTATTTTSNNASPGQSSNAPTTSSADDTSSTSSHVSVGAVAGGVVGGIAVLGLIIIFFFLCQRRKRRQEMDFGETGAPASPMHELDRNHQATIVSPFTLSSSQVGLTSVSQHSQRGHYGHVPTASQSSFNSPPPARSDNMSAYGGYVDPTSSGSESAAGYHGQPLRGQMVSVTPFDHLSYGAETVNMSPTHASSDIEATRKARQNELDERLRSVQQEMMYLSSDVSNGEKGARHRGSVRRQQTLNRGVPIAEAEEPEGEISMEDMQEQLRNMRAQVAYLQEQQRSAWAQGLTDDPPPGYSPAAAA